MKRTHTDKNAIQHFNIVRYLFGEKNICKRACMLIIIGVALMMIGCTPANYTSEKKKEITELHKADVDSWFSTNLPDAKVNSAHAYATGTDLYAAMVGTYTYDKKDYDFLYSYNDDCMYLGQEYENMINELKILSAEYIGVKAENIIVRTEAGFGTGVEAKLENDNYQKNYLPDDFDPENATGKIRCENVIPYGITGKEYAEKLMAGEEVEYGFMIEAYVDTIPDYDHSMIADNVNLAYVCYERAIDWNYSGIYRTVYYDDFALINSIHIEELEQDFYGGYYISENLKYNEETDELEPEIDSSVPVIYKNDGSNEINLEIPGKATLILFSNGGKYTDCYEKFNGEPGENEFKLMEKNLSGKFFDEYDVFEASIHLPKSKYKGYTLTHMHRAEDGKYTVRCK